MAWFKSVRAYALSAVLAASCASPALHSEVPPVTLTPAEIADQLVANALARPAAPSDPFDIEALNGLLGEIARISYDTAGPDAGTGAYRLTGVRAEILGDKPITLFTADEALFWNADLDGLVARINGENLETTLNLFDRIELGGVKVDLTGYYNAVDDAVTAALDEGTPETTVYESATMSVDRFIFGGMTLHPWTYKERDGEDAGIAAIRLLSAVARSFSLDTSLLLDAKIEEVMHTDDISTTMGSVYERQFIHGYDRGNIAAIIQSGIDFSGIIPLPALDTAPVAEGAMPEALIPIEISARTEYSAWNGIELANLLEWGEHGEMPPFTERNLWSFGNYVVTGSSMDFAGKPMFRIGHLEVSADKFAWFLPELITIRHEDASLHLADMLMAVDSLGIAGETNPGEPSIAEIAGILERTGLATISGDGAFSLSWDSDTGETLLESYSLTDNLYTDDTRFSLTLPSYAALLPGFGIDGRTADEELLGQIFEAGFAFRGGHYSMTDAGLLDAIASLVIEFANLAGAGEDDAGDMFAGFSGSTPDAVRGFASMMLMFSGSAFAQDIPGSEAWIQSLAGFIAEGGMFRIELAPDVPVTSATFAMPGDAGMAEAPPLDFVSLLGIRVEHTPPAEPAGE